MKIYIVVISFFYKLVMCCIHFTAAEVTMHGSIEMCILLLLLLLLLLLSELDVITGAKIIYGIVFLQHFWHFLLCLVSFYMLRK